MISVIIPCYNYGHLISETIESVIAQTHSDWEIIIVDDGSTDNTEEVVMPYTLNENYRVGYYRKENAGPSAARNFGIRLARGEFIHFLDADDLVQSAAFEKHIEIFAKNPALDIVYGNIRYISSDFKKDNKMTKTFWGSDKEWTRDISGRGKDILPEALKGNFAHLSTTIYRKTIVDKAGGFDETKKAAEDYHFLIRCVLADANILYNNEPGAYALIRWHAHNSSKNSIWMREGEKKVHEELIPILEKTNNREAIKNNLYAIKGLTMLNTKSWKTVFMSGGRFEPVKKIIQLLGLSGAAKKIFYRK